MHLQAAFAGTTLDELEDPLMAVNVPQSARLSHLFSTLQALPLATSPRSSDVVVTHGYLFSTLLHLPRYVVITPSCPSSCCARLAT